MRPPAEYLSDALVMLNVALRARGDDEGCTCEFCAAVRAAMALVKAVAG